MKTLLKLVILSLSLLLFNHTHGTQPHYVSPIVHPDRTVTFTSYAPEAREVYVELVNSGTTGAGKTLMKKQENGLWTATLGPFLPEIYYYLFHTDSTKHCDVRNPNIKKWLFSVSVFEVPGKETEPYQQHNIPHGSVRSEYYHSPVQNRGMRLVIYLPPDYSEDKEYPTTFLLHGWGGEPFEWIETGRINFINDYLIHSAKIEPMILVMPEAHPYNPEIVNTPLKLKAFKEYRAINNPTLAREISEYIIPYLESEYSISKDPQKRAIIGVSMGGEQAIELGLNNSDMFGSIIAMSASYYRQYEKMEALNSKKAETFSKNQLFRIAFGQQEMEQSEGKLDQFKSWLEANDIPHQWSVNEGGHEWDTWRLELLDALPKLFPSR